MNISRLGIQLSGRACVENAQDTGISIPGCLSTNGSSSNYGLFGFYILLRDQEPGCQRLTLFQLAIFHIRGVTRASVWCMQSLIIPASIAVIFNEDSAGWVPGKASHLSCQSSVRMIGYTSRETTECSLLPPQHGHARYQRRGRNGHSNPALLLKKDTTDAIEKKHKALIPENGDNIQDLRIVRGMAYWLLCPLSVNNMDRLQDLMGCHFSYSSAHSGTLEEHPLIKC